MCNKSFKTYKEQIDILKRRGLLISNETLAEKVLSSENYYRLINGYKDLFLDTSKIVETYKSGTTFDEIYALYKFDEELRSYFLISFLSIENNLKAYIAYEFSKSNGANGYLDANNFNYIQSNQQEINKLISKINSMIADKSRYDRRLQHYNYNHGGILPLWVIINLLTLGNVSKFFKYMNQSEQNSVARRFNIKPNILNNYLKNITLARNVCAHSDRFFSLRFYSEIGSLPEHDMLKISLKDEKHIMGVT